MAEAIGIGSTVWVWDENRRVYVKDHEGRAHGGPIYREHWIPAQITGETRVSWVTNRGKLPKKRTSQNRPEYCISQAEIDDDCWVRDHVYRISGRVERCGNAAVLRQIAALVGYEPGGAK